MRYRLVLGIINTGNLVPISRIEQEIQVAKASETSESSLVA